MMTKKINEITSYLNELYPNAKCELLYQHDYELVIAVMLSSQTTDKKVNAVTKKLFSIYKNLNELKKAELNDITKILQPLGMSNKKAKFVIEISQMISDTFSGIVPSSRNELMRLPGVGNKTANVVRAELFKIPEIPVDTHVARICERLSLVSDVSNPIEIEKQLKMIIPDEIKVRTHHQLISFGRYFCKAKNPSCKKCDLRSYCSYNKKSI